MELRAEGIDRVVDVTFIDAVSKRELGVTVFDDVLEVTARRGARIRLPWRTPPDPPPTPSQDEPAHRGDTTESDPTDDYDFSKGTIVLPVTVYVGDVGATIRVDTDALVRQVDLEAGMAKTFTTTITATSAPKWAIRLTSSGGSAPTGLGG